MKAILLSIIALGITTSVFSQTNTFPSTGNAGIGTTSPTHALTLGSATNGLVFYKTADQITNFERVKHYWNVDTFTIASEKAGQAALRDIQLASGTSNITLSEANLNLSLKTRSRTFSISNGGGTSGFFQFIANTGTENANGAMFGLNKPGTTGWATSYGINNIVGIAPTIAQTGTAGYRGLIISPYELSTGSGIKNLLDVGLNSNVDFTGTHTSKFTINNEGSGYFAGKVGIGITSPTSALTVSGTVAIKGESYNAFQSLGEAAFYASSSSGTYPFVASDNLIIQPRTSTPTDIVMATYNGTAIDNRMVVKSSGNVGIGTTNPDQKLAVNGTIHTKEVKVDLTGWSDYVFKPSYKLPTLAQVDAFISQNGHLPDVPSAAEVERDGVMLGEMNKLLLKKIEELTLYMLEKEKQVKAQEARIKNLETLVLKKKQGR